MLAQLIAELLRLILKLYETGALQRKAKEIEYARRQEEARKAIVRGDMRHVAAIMADQHDRVLALCGGSRGRNDHR